MPDQPAAPGAEPADAEAVAQPGTEPRAAGEPDADASADGAEPADAGEVFMNLAARRAHAQGGKPRRPSGTSGQFGRRGTVQGPRQWGNRRSG